MSVETCPHCGGELEFLDKDTSSGREIREYRCLGCSRIVGEDRGVALWQALHDANEEAERRRAETAAKQPWWKFWAR